MSTPADANTHPTGRHPAAMVLTVHVKGAPSYTVGDEIWNGSLPDAIFTEAETIASYAGPELLASVDQADRDRLRDRIIGDMTSVLQRVGDQYRAPDGVLYSLAPAPADESAPDRDTLTMMASDSSEPIVEEVLRFENLPLGSKGTRRAIVRWSDGTESPALTWYADEILVCEGDLIGKTRDAIRSLHFRRDRDWLQS